MSNLPSICSEIRQTPTEGSAGCQQPAAVHPESLNPYIALASVYIKRLHDDLMNRDTKQVVSIVAGKSTTFIRENPGVA